MLQVQALVALLGPLPVLAVLLVQVVPAQGGLRVVVVLAACHFPPWVTFPNDESAAIVASVLRWNRISVVNTTVQSGVGP